MVALGDTQSRQRQRRPVWKAESITRRSLPYMRPARSRQRGILWSGDEVSWACYQSQAEGLAEWGLVSSSRKLQEGKAGEEEEESGFGLWSCCPPLAFRDPPGHSQHAGPRPLSPRTKLSTSKSPNRTRQEARAPPLPPQGPLFMT